MKTFKNIAASIVMAFGFMSALAETTDFTEGWNVVGSTSVGKSLAITIPGEGEGYYKLSGVSVGNEYTFIVNSTNVDIEVLYKYKVVDEFHDTYIYGDALGDYSGEDAGNTLTWYVKKDSWDVIQDDGVKPTGYFLHVYGDEGETVTVTSSKGLVVPPKAGFLTVNIRGADTATWSLKGQAGAYTNGQTVTIMGQQTVVFSTMKGLAKPANITVTPMEEGQEFNEQGIYGYKLTLKGTGVTAEYEGKEYTSSLTVAPGDEVALRASQDEALIFQSWTPSKAYDFGSGYSASSAETTIVMPSAALTMTANYLKATEVAYMTMYAYGVPVTIGEETVEPTDGDLLWSTDGKTWYACGVKTLVKKGSYTVQWKSASGTWVGPAKSKVTLAGGQDYSNTDNPAKFTFATILRAVSVVYANGAISESTAGGTVTMKPTDGRINATATAVTLTAKANKNYVFLGWQYEKDYSGSGVPAASGTATQKMTLKSEDLVDYLDEDDYQVHYQGVFRPLSDYTEDSVRKAVATVSVVSGSSSRQIAPTYEDEEEGLEGSAEVKLGLSVAATVTLDCTSEAKPLAFKLAKGTLPKGIKFDATNGKLTGTPTVTGTYPLTLTATDPAGHAYTLSLSLVVYSVFDPVVGDWRALLTDEDGIYAGLLEMSITDKGKASAKVITASGTTSCAPTVTWTPDEEEPDAQGTFSVEYAKATGNAKSGSYLYLAVGADGENNVEFLSRTWKNGVTNEVALSGAPARGYSTMLKDETFAATFLGKYFTVALTAEDGELVDGYRTPEELIAPGYLTLTTDKKGTVKVAGKLADGEKVSASALLLPWSDGSGASALVFVVPSGYKKKGSVALQLDLAVDAESLRVTVTSSVGSWTTPPLIDAIAGYTPEEGEDEFLPGLLALSANGSVYSALSDLTDYYLALSIEAGLVSPTLEYSYTEEKQKVYGTANAVFNEYSLDSESGMLTGGKGGKITVAKSGTPWKDGDEWNYDETKSGEEITNPGSLTISYKPATGIFSGKFNLFFDYEVPQYDKSGTEKDPKLEHKSVSCSYEGVLLRGEADVGTGSAVYSGKYTYEYVTSAGKAATKTFTRKYALSVDWTLDGE